LVEYYGSLHASGHVTIGNVNDDPGVMDNLINSWEEKQEPNDFSNSPPVKLQDVILVFKDKLPINYGETQDEEAAAFGEKTFGGDNFNTDVSDNDYVTNELETKMKTRVWTHISDSGSTEEIDYLFPREFYYFFRVENTSSSNFDATFRVFLVPEELVESRRHWIGLDKFKECLPPNSKTVVYRDCDMSSVVRQPPQKTEDELDNTALPIDDTQKMRMNDFVIVVGLSIYYYLEEGKGD
jgi:tyrosinase